MSIKPFMHAAGKSDSPVVPAKASNKEDPHSAEGWEGSGLIKESAVPSHTGRTLRRKAVSQGLDGVRQATKKEQRLRFTALLHPITEALLAPASTRSREGRREWTR